MHRHRILYLTFLLVLFSFSISCNYPGRSKPSNNISQAQLRQTLSAQSTSRIQTLTPQPVSTQTSAPAQTTDFPMPTENPMAQEFFKNTVQDDTESSYTYYAQSGDTLPTLLKRFQVTADQVSSSESIPAQTLIPLNQKLLIVNHLGECAYPAALLPDSEVINSPSAAGFNIDEYVQNAGGYLSTYSENVYGEMLSGSQIVQRVASEASVNPRLLLAFLEYRSHWVLGQPESGADTSHPIGFRAPEKVGLYQELVLTGTQLNLGYYGWRLGNILYLKFPDGRQERIHPELNAGTVAVQHLLSLFHYPDIWVKSLYGEKIFPNLYREMFGDPGTRAASVEPLLPVDLEQPVLELPIPPGERWSLTGGPHYSWNTGSPRGGLDFAPVTGEPACSVSRAWATAAAPGLVVRSANNALAIDLDGDGYEQTGWVVVYVHLAGEGRVPQGTQVKADDPLGHPSCERGVNTGTHVHIARKYNGEWLSADGPIQMTLSGWVVYAGLKNYQGELIKGDQIVTASPVGPRTSIIVR